jgi:hypothetical protein
MNLEFARFLLDASFGLTFDPEDGGNMFLRNIGELVALCHISEIVLFNPKNVLDGASPCKEPVLRT